MDMAIVAGYLLLLVGIGLRGGRQVKSAADFTASGGRYGTGVLFASLAASYVGGGYSVGNAQAAFENGISTTMALMGFSLSMILIGRFLVPGVARFPGCVTVGGIIGVSYGRAARVLTGFFAFLCCVGVVGAQMEAMGLIFHELLGIAPFWGVLLGCSIVLIYSTFGGLQSVITADILQFILLATGMPLLLILSLHRAGGAATVLNSVPADYFNVLRGTTLPGFLSAVLMMALGEAFVPPYTQRLLIGKSPQATGRATVLSGLFSIPFFVITGLIGLCAYVLNVTDNSAEAMPALILNVLPVGLRGLVMAATVSIMLSAADGFLNGAAVSLVCDTLVPLRPAMSDRRQLLTLRGVNLLTGLLAMALALAIPDVFGILMLAYSFWCPLILVPLVAAFMGVRSNGRAFRRALIAGLCGSILWGPILGNPWSIDAAIIGTACNAAVFSWQTRRFRQHRAQMLRFHCQ